jgi:hypothetical protein
MVIQELPVPAVHEPATPPKEVAQVQPPALGAHPFAFEALAPALHFASAFSSTPAGFSPTSLLIEIFGSLAAPGVAGSIAAGLLLGLSGIEPGLLTPEQALSALETIRTTKSLQLNGSLEVPFLDAEHLILTPTQPDGIRLTAYHCVHPFETRQYIATTNPLSFTES